MPNATLNARHHKPLWGAIEVMHSNAVESIEICETAADYIDNVCSSLSGLTPAQVATAFYDNNPDAIAHRLAELNMPNDRIVEILHVIECSEAQ